MPKRRVFPTVLGPRQNPEELQHQFHRGESLVKYRKKTDFVLGLRAKSCILSTG